MEQPDIELEYDIESEMEALGLGLDTPVVKRAKETYTERMLEQGIDLAVISAMTDFKIVLDIAFRNKMRFDKNMKLPTKVQKEIADYLQYGNEEIAENNPQRYWLVVQACRGMGKTEIASVFVAWMLFLDPTLKCMIVSKNETFSKRVLQSVRNQIETNPLFHHLKPSADAPTDNSLAFYVPGAYYDKDPSVYALSIEQKLQGMRADVILADDVESVQNSETKEKRDILARNVKEFISISKPGACIIMLGTPQINDTLYHRLIRNGYNTRIWPALYPTAEQMQKDTYGPYVTPTVRINWKPELIGKAVDPERFSMQFLLNAKTGSDGEGGGASYFELQYQLDPSLSDADRFPLKTEQLLMYTPTIDIQPITGKPLIHVPLRLRYDSHSSYKIHRPGIAMFKTHTFMEPAEVSRETAIVDTVIMSIDPSGDGKDECGYAVLGLQGGRVFLLDSGGFPNAKSPEAMRALVLVAKKYGVTVCVPEKNLGNGMYGMLLQPVFDALYPCRVVHDFNVSGQKEMRIIRTLEPLINSHRLIVSETVIAKDPDTHFGLLYQLSKLTSARKCLPHYDRLDALAIGCQYIQTRLKVDLTLMENFTRTGLDQRNRLAMNEEYQAYKASGGANNKGYQGIGVAGGLTLVHGSVNMSVDGSYTPQGLIRRK